MKKLPVVATLITFMAIVILLKLGFWQLQRGDEKRDIAQQVEEQGETIYRTLSNALNDNGPVAYRKVTISGTPIVEKLIYWDNRIVNGQVGYEVLLPLETNAGIILVNLGWIADKSYRQSLPEFALATEHLTETAVLYQVTMNRLMSNEHHYKAWPLLIAQPDIAFLSEKLGSQLLPYIAFIVDSGKFGLKNNFKPVTMSPEKHLGYAIQWFGLAIACLLVYVFAVKKKWHHDRKTDE